MATNYKELYAKWWSDPTRASFITDVLTTFNADVRKEVPFMLFPRQLAFLESVVKYPNTIAIKHRQAGITTVSSAWVAGQCVFASHDSPETVLCIGNKLDISEQLVEKIGNFLDQVPRWLWGPDFFSPDPKSEKNSRSIYKSRNKDKIELFNGCKIYARSSGTNAARGISAVSILIFDEAAFIENGISVYAQAVAATSSVKDAKIIMVSTPNGKDQLYYKTYANALSGENNYHPVEFKWYQDLRYQKYLKWYKKNEETGDLEWDEDPIVGSDGEIPYNEERWRKLEREGWTPTSPWYIKMCKSFNNDAQRIAQELDVSFLGSADNVIPPDVIEFHRKCNAIQIDEDWPLKDVLVKETWIWEDPIPNHRYICAVDNSSGAADDRTAIEILDIDGVDENGNPSINQVLEYYGKRTGDEVGELAFRYASAYNEALIVVECIGAYGDATVLYLMNRRYKNLYYDEPNLRDYTRVRKHEVFTADEEGKLPGFRTSSVRPQMIANFASNIIDNVIKIRSMRVIKEMDTWIYKNGRPDHMAGYHDDALMCLAMAMFILEYYLRKKEKNKARTERMIASWRVNNGNTPSKERAEEQSNINSVHPKHRPPFYSSRQREDRERQRLMAMIMLGGYRARKN